MIGGKGEKGALSHITGPPGEKGEQITCLICRQMLQTDVIIAPMFSYENSNMKRGEPGIKGERGYLGIKGDRGEKGIQGIKGEFGQAGFSGLKGEKGAKGEQGIQGPKGW
ncbi:macrophage receptor MARCO-like [Hydractinia symbiolongicarpus]|uniref:macrophage receptor MARCO-like n=1 Tax=Hydractinia symbiolongicarpus TaxID=13093 RepID=UPI00254EAB99|nr:macrophage receptor MARCO-like [Hydractinia symbiolongicarpus]